MPMSSAVRLSLDALRERAPAVFASAAHERTSAKYTFIPTERVLSGLMNAGFVPVDARQTQLGAQVRCMPDICCDCDGGSRPCSSRTRFPRSCS